MAESRDLVVFSILRESTCSERNKALWKGDLLFKDGERGLCMSCADLDELVYLPSGDAALTRRARKYSPLSAVVVRFSRARRRYERQGILISETALDQAEEECLADSELRVLRRERDTERRAEYDQGLGRANGEEDIRAVSRLSSHRSASYRRTHCAPEQWSGRTHCRRPIARGGCADPRCGCAHSPRSDALRSAPDGRL